MNLPLQLALEPPNELKYSAQRGYPIRPSPTPPQPQAAAAAAVLPGPPGAAHRGQRPEVFPAFTHARGAEGARHGPQTGAAGDRGLSGAGAQQ